MRTDPTGHNPDAARPTPASRLKRAGFWAIYGIAAAVFIVGALEFGVRAFGLAPPLKIRYEKNTADPHLPFRPIPNLTHIFEEPHGEYAHEWRHNSMGYRDVEHDFDKPDDTFRIFAMGDSFTWGAGAEFNDTYLHVLEQRLNGRSVDHPPVEIIKAGIYAFFPAAHRLLLEHDGARFSPDLVMLQLFPNDLAETAMGLDNIQPSEEGYLMTQDARNLGRMGKWLYMKSHLARIYLRKHLDNKLLERISLDPDDLYRNNGFYEPQWREMEEELKAIKDICAQLGAPLILIYIPEKDLNRPDAGNPPARLARWAAENGVDFVDLLAVLRAAHNASPATPLYWAKDSHCTPAGYRVIADHLFEELTTRQLVP